MNSIRNLILSIIFVYCLSFLGSVSALNQIGIPPDFCFQERPDKFENDNCQPYSNEFCNSIVCEPIENCEENEKTKIIQNITGRGCCAACVTFLEEEDVCEVRSKLKPCRNGLYCNPATKKCNLPPKIKRCMREVHNRHHLQKNNYAFYVEGTSRVPKATYFQFNFATDIENPTCAPKTGDYEQKQCRGSKCFCVEPETGKFTFGLSVKDSPDSSSDNVTCECAQQFRKTLDSGLVERPYMEHYAQIHSKCDGAGNYEELQCINQTCFCVDEQTGRPKDEKVAIYGALKTLSCFDEEKGKALGKDSDSYYLNECERQLMRTQQISLHFMDKGTDLIGLDKTRCSYDGKFAPKQCKPGACNCVTPDEAGIAMPIPYASERTGGKDAIMDCRCARQVYYANTENKGYFRPQCEGNGNYKAYQSFDSGRKTYCTDENGERISEIVPSTCYDQFVNLVEPGLSGLTEFICTSMRQILTDEIVSKDFFTFDLTSKTYRTLKEKPPPEQMFSCTI